MAFVRKIFTFIANVLIIAASFVSAYCVFSAFISMAIAMSAYFGGGALLTGVLTVLMGVLGFGFAALTGLAVMALLGMLVGVVVVIYYALTGKFKNKGEKEILQDLQTLMSLLQLRNAATVSHL